ncbi:restriction endonuclease subunit S [Gemmobacter fulvus]|uniref:restriction endonuclease subunit S n=1 Tax=Gemmobacter fulvus TaxID=2840474 RepID=UPI0027967ADA|nr:restriction endonuclease subunit S [Gemmobacter fulvus]MDQ1850731.1 restriction endonuclease subunit S [Gemmobacter fulvus]
MTDLPTSWHICTFGDVASIRNGFAFKSTDFLKTKESPEDIPLVRQSQLVGATVDLSNAVFLPAHFFALHQGYVIETGDLIIGMSGSIGAVCQYKETVPALQNQRTGKITLRFKDAMSDRFFGLFLMNVETELKKLSKGMGVQNISGKDIEALSLALPPLPEQHRIVAKIEELFSELDAGTASLTRARAQLKTYRQALLKAAFEGKLTAPWRAANPDKLESPETLLSRIRKERDSRFAAALDDWQTALSEWRAGGEVGRKPGKPSRPDPLSELAASNAVLDGWPIFELRDLISVSSGQGLTSSEMSGGSHPVYGGNGITGFHDQWFLKEPNLIIGRVGAKCGVTHITQEFAWVTDNALIVTPLVDSFDQRFFLYRLEYMNLNALGSSTGQPVISGSKIYGQEIALPTLGEQSAVADIIEALDSGCAKLSEEITTALTRIAALRQSILKKAFSGQLVPQDPADEPASALLARLAQAPAPKPRRKTKP